MDLKITSLDGTVTNLSSLGISVLSFDEEPAEIERVTQSFAGRNGSLDYGGRYTSKKLTATLYAVANNMTDDINKENAVNGLLSGIDGYYIQEVYSDDGLYKYNRPGESTGDVLFSQGTIASTKRFLVYRSDSNSFEFKGKVGDKIISTLDVEFTTLKLPFGESIPKDITVANNGNVQYSGTVANNQLESGWYVEITASAAMTAGFDFTIGDNHWECSQPIESGDVIKLAGITNLLNNVNFNALTNAAYFVLQPGSNKVTSTLSGTIVLRNVKNLYL